MKITTKSGFVCKFNENKAKDWRFCEAVAKWDSNDGSKVIEGITFAVPFLLGEEGKNALIEHVTDEEGIASSEKVMEEFREILDLLNAETKKSSSSPE